VGAGGGAAWEGGNLPPEVWAIQPAIHLRFRDRVGLAAEYMNAPPAPEDAATGAIDPAAVAAKVTNLPRGVVPRSCTRLTAFVDVGVYLLWSAVVAWDENFGGQVVAYHVFPEQGRHYFAASDPRPGLGDLPGSRGQS